MWKVYLESWDLLRRYFLLAHLALNQGETDRQGQQDSLHIGALRNRHWPTSYATSMKGCVRDSKTDIQLLHKVGTRPPEHSLD